MNVLIIEDDREYRYLLVHFLKKAFPNAAVQEYDPGREGRPGCDFDWSAFDVLILDYRLGENDTGLDWLRFYKRDSRSFPATILLTAVGSEELAVRALRNGAHDYLRKQTLTGKKLAESVADALNVRVRETKNESSLTINASRFSKSFFYGQFDHAFREVADGEKRAVVLIRVDEYEVLLKTLGFLAMDEIARFIATGALEALDFGRYRSRATRFTDASIAILAGDYRDESDLRRALGNFCDRLRINPPLVNGAQIPITVSIGAVPVFSGAPDVQGVLERAEKAVDEAAGVSGNSIVLSAPEEVDRDSGDTAERVRVFDAKAAFRENRLQAMFRPLMCVSERSSRFERSEFFQVSPRFVTRSGEYLVAEKVLAEQADDTLGRVMDRWKIRECVSRLLEGDFEKESAPGFLIELGKGSCSDINLAHWITKLIKHHKKQNRAFPELCFSVPASIFVARVKPVATLLAHLKIQHKCRSALSGIDDPSLCQMCFKQCPFDLISLAPPVVDQITGQGNGGIDAEKLIEFSHSKGALVVAGDIRNSNDLHAVISAGIDIVCGDFIGAEQEEIEAVIGIEAVSLG